MDSYIEHHHISDFPNARTDKEGIEFIAAAVRNLERKCSPFNSGVAISEELATTLRTQLEKAAEDKGAHQPQQVWNAFARAVAPSLATETSTAQSFGSSLWTEKVHRGALQVGQGLPAEDGQVVAKRGRTDREVEKPEKPISAARQQVLNQLKTGKLAKGSNTRECTSTVAEILSFTDAFKAFTVKNTISNAELAKALGCTPNTVVGAVYRMFKFSPKSQLHYMFCEIKQDPEKFLTNIAKGKSISRSALDKDTVSALIQTLNAIPEQYISISPPKIHGR